MVATSGSRWRLAPSLVALVAETDKRYPSRSIASDGSLGDASHAARASDHNPKAPRPPGWVDAVDLTDDDMHGCDVSVLVHHLVASKDKRVKYLIHRGTIWKGYPNRGLPAFAPQPYTGPSPHTRHVHVSVTAEGRTSKRSWWPPKSKPKPKPKPKPPTITIEEVQNMAQSVLVKKVSVAQVWATNGIHKRAVTAADIPPLLLAGIVSQNGNQPYVLSDGAVDNLRAV